MVSILYNSPIAIILSWLFGIGGIIANCFVLKVILVRNKLNHRRIFSKTNTELVNSKPSQSSSNPMTIRYVGNRTFVILIFHLACSDLFGSLYLLTLASADLHYRFIHIHHNANTSSPLTNSSATIYRLWISNPFCFIARFLNVLSSFQSVFIITFIAVDRYVCVAFPFSIYLQITSKRAKIICLIGWITGLSIASLFTLFSYLSFPSTSSVTYQFNTLCTFEDLSVYYIRLSLLLLCICGLTFYITTLFLYIGTYYKLRRLTNKIKFSKKLNKNVELKTLKIAATISITNLIAWFPSLASGTAIFINYHLIIDNTLFLSIAPNVLLLFQVNCTINPIIYIFNTSQQSAYLRKITFFFRR